MSLSLDGYVATVDGELTLPLPDDALFRHFTELESSLAGNLYGRRIYEVMRYWDEDQPDWNTSERDFAAAWRAHPKWVVSRSLKSVGPNAALVDRDVEAFVRNLKSEIHGEVNVAGPELAGTLAKAGLIDQYRLYFRPVVLGGGKPYFTSPRPALRLTASDRIGADTMRLTYDAT